MAAPFGDIYSVQTPALNQLSNRLYAEQKQRELQQQQDSKALDNEFSKNMSGMRDVDIPLLTKAYGDFKTAYTNNLKKRGEISPQDQVDVLTKKAAVYDIINKSKEQRQNFEDPLRKGMLSNKNDYTDNASDLLKESMNTPINQLGASKLYKDDKGNPIDLTNASSYKYTPTTDFTKDMHDAFGGTTPRDLGKFDESTPGAMQKTIAQYKGFNDPYTAYNILVNNHLQDKKKQNDFIKSHQFSPLVEQQIIDRGTAIMNDPTYRKVYGLTGNEQFSGDDTELGKAAKLAVLMSVQKPIRDFTAPTDVAAKTAAANTEWNRRNAISFKQHQSNIILSGNQKAANPDNIDKNAEGYINDTVVAAKNNNGTVQLPADDFKAIFGRSQNPKDVVNVDDKGNFTLQSKKYDVNSGGYVDATPTTLTRDQAKTKLIKSLHLGLGSDNTGEKKPGAINYSKTKSGMYNGKKITIGQRNGKWFNTQTGEELK